MFNVPPKQYKSIDRGSREFNAQRIVVGPGSFEFMPRLDYQTNTSTVIAAGDNPLWEAIYGTTLQPGTLAFGVGGLTLTTHTAQYEVLRLVAANIRSYSNIFCAGHSAGTRTGSTAGDFLKTAASTSSNIGRGIGFSIGLTTGSSIASCEIMAGLMSGQGANAGYISSTGPVIGASTAGNTGPTDGFYFFYNSSIGPNWYACVNYGSTDEIVDTGIPVAASTQYWLSAELDTTGAPRFYINGNFVRQGTAVDAATVLVPCFAVKTLAAGAKSISVTIPDIYANAS